MSAERAPLVFINYRVEEQPAYATLLDRTLSERLGSDAVFLAARSLQPGDRFAEVVFANLRRSSVVVALMGPRWAAWTSADGTRRLEAPDDWVHRELSEALALGIRVVPVLLEDATLPEPSALPAALRPLAESQYLRIRHYTVETDLANAAGEIERLLGRTVTPPDAPEHEAYETAPRHYAIVGTRAQLAVFPGSILRAHGVSTWVSSENTEMEMARTSDFSISGIVRYWGAERDEAGRVTDDRIAAELNRVVGDRRPVSPGTAIATTAGALAESHGVRYLVHVASVVGEPGAGYRQVRNVSVCVANALSAVEDLPSADSILLPLLGVGSGGGDVESTARRMVDAVIRYFGSVPESRLRVVYLLAHTNREWALVSEIAAGSPGLRPLPTPR
jgi:O-acetyl-ADP-ribose deacetylase (regulator of RNase III)